MSSKVAANDEMTASPLRHMIINDEMDGLHLWGMEAQAQVSHLIIRCNLYSIQSIPVHTKDAWRIWHIGWLQVTAVTFNRRLKE